MASWIVSEPKAFPGRTVFLCGACAVVHYNEDRDERTPPVEGDPKDGEAVLPCVKDPL